MGGKDAEPKLGVITLEGIGRAVQSLGSGEVVGSAAREGEQ